MANRRRVRCGTGRPNPSRETKFSGVNEDREIFFFPVQLTTSRIGNITRLILTLAIYTKQSMDQPGKVASPARSQLNRENGLFSLCSFVPKKLVSRDRFGSLVPRQPAHLHIQAESGAYLRDSSRVPRRRPFIYLNRHTFRRYFQHAHFIPIVGVGKRGAY